MRKLKAYVPKDEFQMRKTLDKKRFTAVLIRQSDHKAAEDHVFSRESQLKLIQYAMRLRGDETDEWVRLYDEGAGTSGQKRIDQREELNRLYRDIKAGLVGSLVIIHEDRLFRDEFHTNDTTFIKLLAEYDVLLFVRTDQREYDCTKASDRNSLLEKMIASRNYLDDHVLGRMNGSQEDKALRGLFDGRNLPMGFVTIGKKKEQVILTYEPWAIVIRWLFARFRELESIRELCREIQRMPYLFPDPTAEDLMSYTFKINMTKVPGGFKPTNIETIRYMLTNAAYIGCWTYQGAIVKWDNHPAIVDQDLFLWTYYKLTGTDLVGNPVEGAEQRRFHANSAQAVLKYVLTTPEGTIYTDNSDQPEYHRESLARDTKLNGKLFREKTFRVRAVLIDDIFLARVKEIALADPHLAEHIEASIVELAEQHAESIISIDDQLAQVRLQIDKKLATINDKILNLDDTSKERLGKELVGLRQQEAELLKAQKEGTGADLKADYEELHDVLHDVPGELDKCSMSKKQKLARLITERVSIEEVSTHWLRLTVLWRGGLAHRPDVCLIWRRRGRHSEDWTTEEDAFIRANYPAGDKLRMLEALPLRSWNMIFYRALTLKVRRLVDTPNVIPQNVTMQDLNVIPDREAAIMVVTEACTHNHTSYGVWLYSADLRGFAKEVENRDGKNYEWAGSSLSC